MNEQMHPDMSREVPMISEAEFEEMRGKVSGLSEQQKADLIAQLHDPQAGHDERFLSNNRPEI